MLACYCFNDVDRRHKILGSETKAFATHGTASNMSIFVSVFFPPSPIGAGQEAQMTPAHRAAL